MPKPSAPSAADQATLARMAVDAGAWPMDSATLNRLEDHGYVQWRPTLTRKGRHTARAINSAPIPYKRTARALIEGHARRMRQGIEE